jgi:hypothetical protein
MTPRTAKGRGGQIRTYLVPFARLVNNAAQWPVAIRSTSWRTLGMKPFE